MTAIEGTKSSWYCMRRRCHAKEGTRTHKYYKNISICKRWDDFDAFLADMGPRPEGLSIDRKDNDGNYEPSNCRWATQKEQVHNSTALKIDDSDIIFIHAMADFQTHQEIAWTYGVSRSTISNILRGSTRTTANTI